jgi:hypothetical protein
MQPLLYVYVEPCELASQNAAVVHLYCQAHSRPWDEHFVAAFDTWRHVLQATSC